MNKIRRSSTIIFASLLLFGIRHDHRHTIVVQGQPQPCGGPAFARVGNNFYIQGGATSGDNLLQHFWALDLTKNWTTSKPTWSALPLGPFNAYHSAGYSADNKSFITYGRDTAANSNVVPQSWVNLYDISTESWSFANNPQQLGDTSRRDFSAVTNPRSNKNYIMGGGAGNDGGTYTNAFSIFDPSTRTMTEVQTPLPGPQFISTYSAVWVSRLNAMLVFGGAMLKGVPSGLFLYHPDTASWTTQTTTGSFAYSRISSCAASNADGTLVAVFGGFPQVPGPGDPYVFILDTVTWTWTTTTYNGRGRGNAACAVVDDTFIIWGGFYSSPNTVNGVPTGAEALLLFSLSKRTWLTTYTPSAALAAGGDTSGGTGGGGSSGSGDGGSGSNGNNTTGLSTGAIGGVIAGGVALILVAIFSVFEKRRRDKKRQQKKEKYGDGLNEAGQGRTSIDMMEHHHQVAPPRPPPPRPLGSSGKAGGYDNYLDPGYNVDGSIAGYSSPATPTTLNFLATGSESGGGSEVPLHSGSSPRYPDGRRSYQSDGNSSAVYFPPPPRTLPQQHSVIPEERAFGSDNFASNAVNERQFNNPQSLVSDGYYPFVSSAGAPVSDQYHDAYGMKHASIISSQSGYSESSSNPRSTMYDPRLSPPPPLIPKRPASGPQGGHGFGSVIEQMSPGAPQAILRSQPSVSHHQQQQGQQQGQQQYPQQQEQHEFQQQPQEQQRSSASQAQQENHQSFGSQQSYHRPSP